MGKVKKAGAARKKRRTVVAKKKKRAPLVKPTPARFAVRELDAVSKCGPDTSVQLLYRVDETNGSVARPHLVFFDKHGWYCDHGRNCPAVSHAQRDARRNHAHMVLAYSKQDKQRK